MLPDDIHVTMWGKVKNVIVSGYVCFNAEILEELRSLNGSVGECLMSCADRCLYEVGDNRWDWPAYLVKFSELKIKYTGCISEYNGNRKSTVGLNDLSIIALAATMKLPLISMESDVGQVSDKKKRIPEICKIEGVKHLTFNDFLRAEKISI